MNFTINLKSKRSNRAKLASRYTAKWLTLSLKLIIMVSAIAGVSLLATSSSLGWIVLLPGFISFMIYLWQKGDLSDSSIAILRNSQDIQIDNLLEFSLLAKLKGSDLSAYDLWHALSESEERNVIGNRYLLDSSFFETLTDKTAGSAISIWPLAENYRQKYQTTGYSNMVILVSLVAVVPNIEAILKSLKLDLSDVEVAIPWMADVLEKRKLAHAKKTFGGIGRDWAFGYTPILRSLGRNISQEIEQYGFFSDTSMHQRIVTQMTQMLSSGSNVTLIGDTGAGKTTCVHAFAETILADKNSPPEIRNRQVIELDAPTLITHAQNPGQLEELMIRILNEAHKAKNIILFFDDAESFFGYGPGSINITHVLQPVMDNSSLKIILAMTPMAWQQISAAGASGKMKPQIIEAADEPNTLAVIRDAISSIEYRNKVVFTYQALKESYSLGNRYVTNLSMPGAALSILEQTANSSEKNRLITKESVQYSVEQAYGIKLQTSDVDESDKLLNLESELHKSVISQDRAVTVVADALRRARSGVGNQNRPVGTFLFLGPTGVGKTELTKALARTYFGDESALIRVDMNQFVSSGDLSRLTSPLGNTELGFLGEVRQKPFSVILLDEIEKAHSSVVNALLQMLDEGIMKDSENRSVSFRDAIIIATSNAGAEDIRAMIDSGQDVNQAESVFVETLISKGFFAPELVNRFDEVVIFRPLNQEDLYSVVDLLIADINKTLNAQKVQVNLTESAKTWLINKGYDPKLGARPMRRMVQRYVENTVAKRLLSRSVVPGGHIELDVGDFDQDN